MMYLYLYLRNLLEREEGQDLIEYALLVFFIALVVLGVLLAVGTTVSGVFVSITTALGAGTGS